MKYLNIFPIFEELFQSDSVIFLAAGVLIPLMFRKGTLSEQWTAVILSDDIF